MALVCSAVKNTTASKAAAHLSCSIDIRQESHQPTMQTLADGGAGAESWHSRNAWAAVPRISRGVRLQRSGFLDLGFGIRALNRVCAVQVPGKCL